MKRTLAVVFVGVAAVSSLSAQEPKLRHTLTGYTRFVPNDTVPYTEVFNSVAFSPDGKTLASASSDGTNGMIRLWDAATAKNTATLNGHTDFVFCVTYSPDGRTLASGSADKTIKLWDVATGKNTASLKGHHANVFCVVYRGVTGVPAAFFVNLGKAMKLS
jgi:WD40 repeat protein